MRNKESIKWLEESQGRVAEERLSQSDFTGNTQEFVACVRTVRPKHCTTLNGPAHWIGWMSHQLSHMRTEMINWWTVSYDGERRWSAKETKKVTGLNKNNYWTLNRSQLNAKFERLARAAVKKWKWAFHSWFLVNWTFSSFSFWNAQLLQWLRNSDSSRKEIDWIFISRTLKTIKWENISPITYFNSESTCFSLSLNKYVGFAAISHSSLGRHSSLKDSLILWLTISMLLFCSSLCFSLKAFLKNFMSILSWDFKSSGVLRLFGRLSKKKTFIKTL